MNLTNVRDTQNTQITSEKEHLIQLTMAAESLLFVAGRPLEYTELRKLLDVNDAHLAHVLDTLAEQLESQERGIRLQRLESQAQLVTAPENARYIAALLGLPMTARLTTAAMETLAVISYRQPMTRAQIEAIRGVNSDRALSSLIQHSLVAEVGRAQSVGRPALFATTSEFLQHFGLTSLQELPHVEVVAPESQNGHSEHTMLEHQQSLTEQIPSENQPGQIEQVALENWDEEPVALEPQNGYAELTGLESQDSHDKLESQNGHRAETGQLERPGLEITEE